MRADRAPRDVAFRVSIDDEAPWTRGNLAASAQTRAVVMDDASRMCRNLQQEMGALFTCSEQDGRQRIRTPDLYPDGDCIDLFCKIEDGVVSASESGHPGCTRRHTGASRQL